MSTRLDILQHAIGADRYGRRERGVYRNHFVAGPGGSDFDLCMAMFRDGLMAHHAQHPLAGGGDLFVATEAGAKYVSENSPPPPKLTRSQKRYRAWLRADCGMPFGEWLRQAENR